MNENKSDSDSCTVNLNLYIRPLLWDRTENDHECNGGYDWGIHGSGILLKYNNFFYFICTRHSIKDSEGDDFNLVKAPISFHDASLFLPFSKCFFEKDKQDSDSHDIVIFPIDLDLIEDKKISENDFCEVYDLNRSISEIIKKDVNCLLVGFPNETSSICSENKKIKTKARILNCKFEDQDEKNILKFKITDLRGVNDLKGMSGGGMFLLSPDKRKGHLIGMLVKGTAKSRYCYILSVDFIKTLINELIEKR